MIFFLDFHLQQRDDERRTQRCASAKGGTDLIDGSTRFQTILFDHADIDTSNVFIQVRCGSHVDSLPSDFEKVGLLKVLIHSAIHKVDYQLLAGHPDRKCPTCASNKQLPVLTTARFPGNPGANSHRTLFEQDSYPGKFPFS